MLEYIANWQKTRRREVGPQGLGRIWNENWSPQRVKRETSVKKEVTSSAFSLRQDSLLKSSGSNLLTHNDCWWPQRLPQRDAAVEGAAHMKDCTSWWWVLRAQSACERESGWEPSWRGADWTQNSEWLAPYSHSQLGSRHTWRVHWWLQFKWVWSQPEAAGSLRISTTSPKSYCRLVRINQHG